MANLIEYRSLKSGEHVKRTRELTQLLIMELLKRQNYRQQLIDCDYSVSIKAVPLHDICRFHHERWYGNGYPENLAGTDILFSHIMEVDFRVCYY